MEMLLREFLFLAFLAQPPQEASEEALDFWRAWWKAEELDGK